MSKIERVLLYFCVAYCALSAVGNYLSVAHAQNPCDRGPTSYYLTPPPPPDRPNAIPGPSFCTSATGGYTQCY